MSTDVDARRDLRLAGCSSVPLAGYLKALGVFRLVAAQKDPQAAGRWNEGRFVLSSRLDEDGLEHFLLEEYRPSPIVAPWNGGSGFYPKDNQAGIEAISGSAAPRFATYRVVVALCREILAEGAFEVRPGGEEKVTLLERLRARLPEAALPWLDAAVVLTDGDPKYPPLLGTGGNDGRLDFTNNFMQRLIELFDPSNGGPRSRAASWLRGALFGESIPELAAAAIGQFAPGDAGGANASIGFEGGSLINPWDFVLMLEGAVLFAAASTRRLEAAGHGLLSYPFTVRPVGAGSGSTATQDEGDARAEIWLPLWPRAVGIQELEALLAEGRATVGGRPARDGLDFARAVAALGVDRGIGAFERYGFLMRAGRAYLATPLGRMRVRRQPNVMLVEELEKNRYLDRLRSYARRDEAPGSVRRLVRSLETGLFELARHGGALRLQEVLAVLGDLQRVVGRSPAARAVVPPVPFLSERWAEAADNFTDEYRIAAALAGLYAPGMPMRVHLAPLTPGDRPRHWDPESRLTVWSEGDLLANLAHVLERRLLEADRREAARSPSPAGRERTSPPSGRFSPARPTIAASAGSSEGWPSCTCRRSCPSESSGRSRSREPSRCSSRSSSTRASWRTLASSPPERGYPSPRTSSRTSRRAREAGSPSRCPRPGVDCGSRVPFCLGIPRKHRRPSASRHAASPQRSWFL